jgi:glycosyltransferase involved in cell wall biosynthesis
MSKPLDLAIDCRLRNSTGIGRYIRELVPRVVAALPEKHILLIGPTADDPWAGPLLGERVKTIPSQARVFRLEEQRLYRSVAARSQVLWCTHFNAPWRPYTKLVVNVHDLIPLHVAKGWKGHVRRLGAQFYLRAVRRNASQVLTLSHAVANELRVEQGFSPESLRPIHLGVAPEWFGEQKIEPALLEGGAYLLYVGNISPHKNVEALMRAFAQSMAQFPHRLVIVGEKRGFTGHADFASLIAGLGDRVSFAQRLSDEELRGLFARADLLVLPSRDEGFGLPPLEAMAVGCPVLTSDCAALLETAALGAHRFKLSDSGDLSRQIVRLLNDSVLRLSKIDEGREWARRFTWERTAEQTVAVLCEVLEGRT